MQPDTDFDRFFETNYDPLVRILSNVFGDRAGAEEAVQDAFIRAYARWNRIRGYDDPVAWIRRVAINRLHDERRARDRRDVIERHAAAALTVETPEYPRSGTLLGLIQSLSPRQQAAIALYYVEGLPVRDVAASMSISEGTVKAHLSKGREKLRFSYQTLVGRT